MVKDLTKGSTGKILWLFALPLLGSVIFQQMYNMADTVIAGQFIGEDALSAVGSSYPITMIFMAMALGCNLGCSVVISRHFGAKHYKEVRECNHNSHSNFSSRNFPHNSGNSHQRSNYECFADTCKYF